jgi:hypothetical protein
VLAFAHFKKGGLFRAIVMTQSTCDNHLAILWTLVLTTSPDVLPWLGPWFGGWISVSTDFVEEILARDSLHGLLIMRSHL